MARAFPAAMILVAAATAAPAISAPATAARPSFACGTTRNAAEKLICGNAELARLDRIVAELFAENRSLSLNGEQAEQADKDQRIWLARRNRCAAVECLRQAHFKRIVELSQALPADG